MYDVVVVAFDSEDKASQALANLKEISAGAGYAVIQAGLVQKNDNDLLLVDEFTGQGVDDQFMGVAAQVVTAAGVVGDGETGVAEVRAAIEAAPAAMVLTVYDPTEDSFDAFFAPYGGKVERWDLREMQKMVREVRRDEREAYKEGQRAERQELHAERKAERKEAFEEFKKDINL